MSLKLVGKKLGMTRVFNEKGQSIPCTVIETSPNVVVQIKTVDSDGYGSVQLGGEKVSQSKLRRVKKPLKGHYAKAKVDPCKRLVESRVENPEEYAVGQEIKIDYFEKDSFVDVIGISKGKGFQGVMKRHGFKGGPASHGSGFHRSPGSTGMCSDPGRTLPGLKMAGHMGSARKTVEGLQVFRVDQEKNVIFVRGAVPGSKGGLVYIRRSLKRRGKCDNA